MKGSEFCEILFRWRSISVLLLISVFACVALLNIESKHKGKTSKSRPKRGTA